MSTETLPSIRQVTAHIRALLVQYLREAGDKGTSFISYQELSNVINQDVTNSTTRHLMNRARKTVLADYGYLFETRSGQGLALLSDSEKLKKVGVGHRKRISKEAQLWREKHDSINPQNLDQPALRTYLKEEMQLSAQEELESSRMRKRIDAAVEVSQKRITAEEIRQAIHESNKAFANMG
jgi:hypothetical protein